MATLLGVGGLEGPRGVLYSDLILTACGDAARSALEAMMSEGTYEYQTEWAKEQIARMDQARAEGQGEGQVRALLTVLEGRGLSVSHDERARIETCTDLAQLDRWLRKVGVVAITSELFAD